MFSAVATAGAVVSLVGALAGPNPAVLEPPPASRIVIDVVTVNGSGCPEGSAAVAMSPDNTAFTVTYSQYTAQVGVGAAATDFRKNCQINLLVHVPQGFTYAIASTDYRGFAALEKGATGVQRANYYFQGSPATVYSQHQYKGPLVDDWHATDVNEVASLAWAPCGAERFFNINTELRVLKGTSDTRRTTSFMTMDSTDGSFDTKYNLAWKKC